MGDERVRKLGQQVSGSEENFYAEKPEEKLSRLLWGVGNAEIGSPSLVNLPVTDRIVARQWFFVILMRDPGGETFGVIQGAI